MASLATANFIGQTSGSVAAAASANLFGQQPLGTAPFSLGTPSTATSGTPILSGLLSGGTTETPKAGLGLGVASNLAPVATTVAGPASNLSSIPSTSTSTPVAQASAGSGFGFANTGKTTASSLLSSGLSVATTAPSTANNSSSALGPLLAQPTKTVTSTSGTGLTSVLDKTTTSAATGLTFSAKSFTAPTSTALASQTGATSQTSANEITFRQLEENVNKWNDDLDELERQFLAQATQINAWDRLVLENGDRITSLNEELAKIKANQDRLDQDLDFIGSQQKDLEEFIVNLEGSLANSAISQPQDAADEQRRDIFSAAENIDCQLKQMTQDLREVIERINSTGHGEETTISSPFGQLERILNAHVDSLNWADQSIENLSKQIDLIQIPNVNWWLIRVKTLYFDENAFVELISKLAMIFLSLVDETCVV